MIRSKKASAEGWLPRILNTIAFLVSAVIYSPFVFSARFALFHGDDFGFCTGTFEAPAKNLLQASFLNAWDSYTTWQGTWLTNFLNPVINPLNWYSFTFLRLELICCLVISFALLCFLSHEICFKVGLKNCDGILLISFLLPFLTGRPYYEVYLWHVGAMAYQVPIMFLALGLALTIRGARRSSRVGTWFGCLCLFLSGGGVLLIGGLGACLTLLLLLAVWLEDGRMNWRYVAAFLAMLTGDLVNVLAPGNYVKASGELTIVKAFGDAIRAVINEYALLIPDLILPAAILVLFIIGLQYGMRRRSLSFWTVILGLIFTPVVTAFPYTLGYDVSSMDLIASRAWFVIDTSTVFCSLCLAFMIGGQIRGYVGERNCRRICNGIGIAAAILFLFILPNARDSLPSRIAENLYNDKIETYATEWHEIFDMLSMRPGENVVIEEQPDICDGIHKVSVGASPDHPNNRRMARYFGNASIVDAWYAYTYGIPDSVD